MTAAVQTTITALAHVVQQVGIGTNISLVRLMWTMVNGSFLSSRGSVHGALKVSVFSDEEIRRSWSALRKGSWEIEQLLSSWQQYVTAQCEWEETCIAGKKVRSIDLTGFWRPRLKGKVKKLYKSSSQKAMPAIIFGVITISGEVNGKRVPLLQSIIRYDQEISETEFQREILKQSAATTESDEVTVIDAGFSLSDLQDAGVENFVIRMASDCTARKNKLPKYSGKGAPHKYGELIRPLARTYKDKQIDATEPDATTTFEYEERTITCHVWQELVTSSTQPSDKNRTFFIYVFKDPHYKNPMILATDMIEQSESIYLFYKERWPVEHPPLVAKQTIGLHRQFVFADASCFRLPELALLTGNIMAHVAAQLPPIATGFWDRRPQATPGRLRRELAQADFPEVQRFFPQLRKKNSIFTHLPFGIDAHRRTKRAA